MAKAKKDNQILNRKLKIERVWFGKVSNSWSTSDTRLVTLVKNPVIRHEWRKDGIAITTKRKYPVSMVSCEATVGMFVGWILLDVKSNVQQDASWFPKRMFTYIYTWIVYFSYNCCFCWFFLSVSCKIFLYANKLYLVLTVFGEMVICFVHTEFL